jgi:hypothetical protein
VTRSLLAGGAYFCLVFAIAFALGALRVTFVTPAVGPLWATLIEVPLMLGVAWAASRYLIRRFGIRELAPACSMGASALALLIAAEAAFSLLAFGQNVDQLLASYRTAAGILGLAAQLAFAIFPVLQTLWRSN